MWRFGINLSNDLFGNSASLSMERLNDDSGRSSWQQLLEQLFVPDIFHSLNIQVVISSSSSTGRH